MKNIIALTFAAMTLVSGLTIANANGLENPYQDPQRIACPEAVKGVWCI